jgi:hypothetical protein
MQGVITRDADIIREYVGVLDGNLRSWSPLARLVAIVKLARLRKELSAMQLEAADEDVNALGRELDERLSRNLARRLLGKTWLAFSSAILAIMILQQAALWIVWAMSKLSASFWPGSPERPAILLAFIFISLCALPMLALALIMGGRLLRCWRRAAPAALAILAVCGLGTFLVVRGKSNPQLGPSSLIQFARERGVTAQSYRQWVESNWLMRDEKFRRDYESYFRNGPGRWITARFKSEDDSAWASSLAIMHEYLDGGQDINGLRQWLSYYLERYRIYSEERAAQEVNALTGEANRRFLGIWQLEPYLKERDQRMYRAYLGMINRSLRLWGLALLALLALSFLGAIWIAPLWQKLVRRSSATYWFPERDLLTTPSFFDAPYKLFWGIHRHYVRLSVTAACLALAIWAAVYCFGLAPGRGNPSSQPEMIQQYLLLARSDEGEVSAEPKEAQLASRVQGLERQLEESLYESASKFKEQGKQLLSQRSDIENLKGLTAQLQQTTSPLPQQLAELNARAGEAEIKTGQLAGEINTTKQQVEGVQRRLSARVGEVEGRVNRLASQAANIEDQAAALRVRTESLEKELDRRARQVEARTEELGERTVELKQENQRLDQLQRIAIAAILAEIEAEADWLDGRTSSLWYRLFNRGSAKRELENLRQRASSLGESLKKIGPAAGPFLEKLQELSRKLDQIGRRLD